MNPSSLELKIPPPLVFAMAAVLMWAIEWAIPALNLALPGREPAAIIAALAGCVTIVADVVEFRRLRTTVNPRRPGAASLLVVSGVYQMTRNPMYVGMLFLLSAWAIYLSTVWTVIGPVAFVIYMNRFQIGPEEKVLESLFGEAFTSYRQKVRRWL